MDKSGALIAGLGMREAPGRVGARTEAGADAVLVHLKAGDPDEILESGRRWTGRVPPSGSGVGTPGAEGGPMKKETVVRLVAGAALLGGWAVALRMGLRELGEAAIRSIFSFVGVMA